jgi:hypothetical protein
MLLSPFDVVDAWVKPVDAEKTGVNAPATRKAVTPRRDQGVAPASAILLASTCGIFTTAPLTNIAFYLIKHNSTGLAIAKRV